MPTFAQKSTIHFEEGGIADLLSKAKSVDKLVFIDVTAVWCKPCKEMEATTFQDSAVSAFFNDNFISKKFDIDAKYDDSISNHIKLESQAVPKFFFLDKEGNIILVDGGLKSNTDFIQIGKKAKSSEHLADELVKLDSIYTQNSNNDTFLINYMSLRKQAGKRNSKILNDYLRIIKEDYLKESVLNIIMENETDIDGKGFQIISDSANRISVIIKNARPDLGYNLYATSLEIIRNTASIAIKTNDRKLLAKCFKEHIRVMQDKNDAQKINEQILEKFNQENMLTSF